MSTSRFVWNAGDLEPFSEGNSLEEHEGPPQSQVRPSNLSPEQKRDFEHHRLSFEHDHHIVLRGYKVGFRKVGIGDTNAEKINLGLRTGRKTPEHAAITKLLDHVTSQKIAHPLTVYRGLGDSVDISKLKPGSTRKDRGYASTTLHPDIASAFAKHGLMKGKRMFHIAKITVPAGSKGHMLDINRGEAEEREEEFLLHRGTHFKVTHHSIEPHHSDPSQFFHVTHMHVVEPTKRKKVTPA
jgi:hypothetical protein